ncbi:MAG: WD40 repeat domain-containing protein [Deltaproteobacteria bacterium]
MSEDREVNSNPTFSKDGEWAFVLDSTASLHRYNTRTWKESAPPMRHPNREKFHSCGFAISDDARYAVTFDAPGENGPDGQLQLWNVTTSQPINAPLSAQNGLSARFMNGGRRLLITPGRGNTRVVKLPSLETDFVLPRHDDVEASRALITTDGRSILTWGYDSRLILTDAVTGKNQGSSHNRARIQSAHTGPDPDFVWLTYDNTAFLLKGHYDCYVVRMDLKTMKPTAIVRVTDYLHRTILSRDGTRLMIHKGKTDHEVIRIFNAETLTD